MDKNCCLDHALVNCDSCGSETPLERGEVEGSVAVIECFQEIPCNPCETACPSGAITIGDRISDLPRLDKDKCTGCGLCVAHCPGLAIFVVEKGNGRARITLPYEYLPVPEVGERVNALDRRGRVVGEAVVERVRNPKSFRLTTLVTLVVDEGLHEVVRSFVPIGKE